MNGWTSRIFIEGKQVSGDMATIRRENPWIRAVLDADKPKKKRKPRVTKYGIERIPIGSSAIIPFGEDSPDRRKTRVAAIIGLRGRTFPDERYAYKLVKTGVEVRRIK